VGEADTGLRFANIAMSTQWKLLLRDFSGANYAFESRRRREILLTLARFTNTILQAVAPAIAHFDAEIALWSADSYATTKRRQGLSYMDQKSTY